MPPSTQARELQSLFATPQVLEHEHGHVMPQRAAETSVIVAFLQEQANLAQEPVKLEHSQQERSEANTRETRSEANTRETRGPMPLVLNGYGAYGLANDPEFSAEVLTLCDQGVVWAIAHVRGGGEFGRQWHEAARLSNKQTAFDDFQCVANFLIEQQWTSAGQIAALGASAGGLPRILQAGR